MLPAVRSNSFTNQLCGWEYQKERRDRSLRSFDSENVFSTHCDVGLFQVINKTLRGRLKQDLRPDGARQVLEF
jgi:hypothetical protein